MIGLEYYYALSRTPSLQAKYDNIWVIMLYAPKDCPSNFYHVPALAPTRSLFQDFRALKAEGKWDLEAFQKFYAPRYIRDLASDDWRSFHFASLLAQARAGMNIALCCTCYYEELCHRSILGGIIQGMCNDIEVVCKGDYSHYWHTMDAV